jgi:predicted nucleotidyltransferase
MSISQINLSLTEDRNNKLETITKTFENIAVEAHILGSVARGESDPYSDLDVWLTFKDKDFTAFLEKRTEFFNQVGKVLRVIEPHQNAPIGGLFSAVLYKTSERLLAVDYYLCPQSNAFTTKESKKIFGCFESLPVGELGLNPQKVTVTDEYRIDFCIGFIFGAIKRLVRKNEQPLDAIFREYNYLREKYNIFVKEIDNPEHTFSQLLKIAENIKEFSNEKQKEVIDEILNFTKLVEENHR